MPTLAATHLASAGGGYEPQRKYNWFLYLNGVPGAEQIRLSIQKAFLPEEANDLITLAFGNEKVYVAGQTTYSEGSLVVHDMVDKNIYGLLRDWRKQVYDPVTGNIGFAAAYKKTARILLVAPDTTSERQFQLTGVWPQKISPGDLTYNEGTGIVEIGMTIRFDKSLPV